MCLSFTYICPKASALYVYDFGGDKIKQRRSIVHVAAQTMVVATCGLETLKYESTKSQKGKPMLEKNSSLGQD